MLETKGIPKEWGHGTCPKEFQTCLVTISYDHPWARLGNLYSGLYENDHFNQAQAEFKKEAKGQSKHAAQKKRGRVRE